MFGIKAMTIRRQRREIEALRSRVEALEERLCPAEGHDWVCVETEYVPDCGGQALGEFRRCRCRRCGKMKWDMRGI